MSITHGEAPAIPRLEGLRERVNPRRSAVQFLEGDGPIIMLVVMLMAGSLWYGQSSRAVARGCNTDPISMGFAPEVNVAMTVKHGADCAIWSRISNTFVESLDVETAPEHGTLQTRSLSGVIYRPAPGYVGHDTFAFVRRESPQHMNRKSLVRVDVRVE